MRIMSGLGAAGLCAVVLLGAEVTARLDDQIRYGTSMLVVPNYRRDLVHSDSTGLRGRPFGVHRQWRLNRWGFRGPDVERSPSRDCRRVLVLGASEALGYYESEGQEFPAQLADSLRGEGCWEVLNAAVAGAPVSQLILLWRNWASRFEPDFVVVYASPGFYLANVVPGIGAVTRTDPGVDRRWWHPRLVFRAKERLEFPAWIQRRRVERGIAAALEGVSPHSIMTSYPPNRLDAFRAQLDTLVTDIHADGSAPVLVTHAVRFSLPFLPEDTDLLRSWRSYTPRLTESALLGFEAAAADAVRDLARERGLAVVDAHHALSGRRELFADFSHFTGEGSGVLAGAIARRLCESVAMAPRGRAIPGCR